MTRFEEGFKAGQEELEKIRIDILKYFRDHNDENVYPSDVATTLDLNYEWTTQIIEQLEREGLVAKI